jgi:hypothetical protein
VNGLPLVATANACVSLMFHCPSPSMSKRSKISASAASASGTNQSPSAVSTAGRFSLELFLGATRAEGGRLDRGLIGGGGDEAELAVAALWDAGTEEAEAEAEAERAALLVTAEGEGVAAAATAGGCLAVTMLFCCTQAVHRRDAAGSVHCRPLKSGLCLRWLQALQRRPADSVTEGLGRSVITAQPLQPDDAPATAAGCQCSCSRR